MGQLRPLAAARTFLEEWPALTATRTIISRQLPVCRFLPDLEALAVPSTDRLVGRFIEAAAALEWRQTYSAADLGAKFLEGYGWTELIGLRGPIPSESIACGFMLLAPGSEYPTHAHEAEELYLPLAGRALWRRGEGDFVERAPGTPIHHPSWLPHATRAETALLTLYVWRRGDLAAKSRLVLAPG